MSKESMFYSLTAQPGWIEYMKLLREKFENEYKKLRNVKEIDSVSYGKICGMLDGLDYATNIVKTELEEIEPQSE